MEIAGIGTAVPRHRITQADSAAICRKFAAIPDGQARLFEEIYYHTGIATRHSVVLDASDGPLDDRQRFFGESPPTTAERMRVYQDEVEPLAIQSSARAIAEAGITPDRITHLVTVSCTGFHAPGFDIALARRLPLRPSIARTHIGFMGCQGALNGLRVARAFIEADPSACVLLCAAELCSLHHYYGWDLEKIIANALFADGSAAAVLTGGATRTRERRYRLVASGSTLIEGTTDAMSWSIGDHGFAMTLSAKVPGLISATIRPWLESWLAQHAMSLGEIRSWAVHPGGPRILASFGKSMCLPQSALASSSEALSTFGNMSSATILFVLQVLRDRGADSPTVAIAFGPGLSIEICLLK